MNPTFTDLMIEAIREKKSILCCGLDPQLRFMPPHLLKEYRPHYGDAVETVGRIFYRFNMDIIDAIEPFVVAVKPQLAFYEQYGRWGMWAFEGTIAYAKAKGLLVIADGKRNDGGDTAEAYAQAYLGEVPFFDDKRARSPVNVDAITVNPWIGTACLDPFLAMVKKYGKGIFVVAKTSFAPNSQMENLFAEHPPLPVWQVLAHLLEQWGEGTEGTHGWRNCGAVIGATYPHDARIARDIMPKTWLLEPGYGAQGAPPDGAVIAADEEGLGITVNSARGIIAAWQKGQFQTEPEKFATAAAKAAKHSRDELNAALARAGKFNF